MAARPVSSIPIAVVLTVSETAVTIPEASPVTAKTSAIAAAVPATRWHSSHAHGCTVTITVAHVRHETAAIAHAHGTFPEVAAKLAFATESRRALTIPKVTLHHTAARAAKVPLAIKAALAKTTIAAKGWHGRTHGRRWHPHEPGGIVAAVRAGAPERPSTAPLWSFALTAQILVTAIAFATPVARLALDLDGHPPACDVCVVQEPHGELCLVWIEEVNERKAFGAAGLLVHRDSHLADPDPLALEEGAQVVLTGGEGQAANEERVAGGRQSGAVPRAHGGSPRAVTKAVPTV
mmetsp:Transcript_85965/g.266198  ORF Transcript_85965/g.266198 Transcript_85965/m.266198 type:complete len:293 (+) Transcript_85965:1298-2176(+)